MPSLDEATTASFVRAAGEGLSLSDRRRREWVAKIPVLHMGNPSIERTLRRSYDDLGALRIEDPNHPDRVVVAAGGTMVHDRVRPRLIMGLPNGASRGPFLALGTLQTLADCRPEGLQGFTGAASSGPGHFLVSYGVLTAARRRLLGGSLFLFVGRGIG